VKEDDFDPDAHYETKVKAGEVWQLGEHRLMCGDSTDPECFAKLMNGERADIAFTSPPYGVNDGSIRKHQEKGKSDHEAKNFYLEHDDNQSTWPQLVEETWQRMHENSDQQFINIQMLADNKRELVKWCARHADNLCDILIWDKGHAAPQMQPNIVSNNYENIYVFGDDKCSRTLKHGNFHGTFGAIIRVGVGQNEYADVHKAVFPVALPGEILKINGNAKSVLDCFGGTGTTMIAAEQMGRKCYMMELDPHYCTIIIARWEKLTGQKAIKLNQ
jgi:DNA modification methylase